MKQVRAAPIGLLILLLLQEEEAAKIVGSGLRGKTQDAEDLSAQDLEVKIRKHVRCGDVDCPLLGDYANDPTKARKIGSGPEDCCSPVCNSFKCQEHGFYPKLDMLFLAGNDVQTCCEAPDAAPELGTSLNASVSLGLLKQEKEQQDTLTARATVRATNQSCAWFEENKIMLGNTLRCGDLVQAVCEQYFGHVGGHSYQMCQLHRTWDDAVNNFNITCQMTGARSSSCAQVRHQCSMFEGSLTKLDGWESCSGLGVEVCSSYYGIYGESYRQCVWTIKLVDGERSASCDMAGPISIACHANETDLEDAVSHVSCSTFEAEKHLVPEGSACEQLNKAECGDFYDHFGEGYRLCAWNIEWDSISGTMHEVCKLSGAKSYPCEDRAEGHKVCDYFESAYVKLGGKQNCSHLDFQACRSYYDDYGDGYRMCDWMIPRNSTNVTNATNASFDPNAIETTILESSCQLAGVSSYPCHWTTTTTTTATNTYRLLPCSHFEDNMTVVGNNSCQDFGHENCHKYYGVLHGRQYQGCVWQVTWDPVKNARAQFCSMTADMSERCPNSTAEPTVTDDSERTTCDQFLNSVDHKVQLADGQRCEDVPTEEDCNRYFANWGDGYRMCSWGYQWDYEAKKNARICSQTGTRSYACEGMYAFTHS